MEKLNMATEVNSDRWFLCPEPNPKAKMRIFCLHYAGGGASMYHSWKKAFSDDVELWAIQLPGRESRYSEPRIQSLSDLVKMIVDVLQPLVDKPFAIFGYSMGALLAFEITRELRSRGEPQPVHLFLASATAPHLPKVYPPLAQLPEDELIDQVRYYFQPPEEIWQNAELLELILPILRDDLSVIESHQHVEQKRLDCSIDVYIGLNDRSAPVNDAQAWSEYSNTTFQLTGFQGGHFFWETESTKLMEKVHLRLNELNRDK